MNLILALLAVSALAVALASHTKTRRLVRDINAITQPHVPARHAVVRRPTGPRQGTHGTMAERDRIPLRVPEAVDTARALIIEAYAAGDDDLLIKPFVTTDADDTPVVIAVP